MSDYVKPPPEGLSPEAQQIWSNASPEARAVMDAGLKFKRLFPNCPYLVGLVRWTLLEGGQTAAALVREIEALEEK